jgi:hypothetical protein
MAGWGALRLAASLAACLAPTGATPSPEPGVHPVPATGISVASCFTQRSATCPSPLADAVHSAEAMCREMGGTLGPVPGAAVWSLDVDQDGALEYLIDIAGSLVCDGAPNAFSCGSLGCPLALYQRGSDGWRIVGSIDTRLPETLTVLPSGELRVDCLERSECRELRYYQRCGERYELAYLMVRGHRVEIAGSVHGLHALATNSDLLDTPAEDGTIVDRYEAGTEVAIVGSTDRYYYVSPCNACRSGFLRKSAVEAANVVPP